jgi:protease II
MGDEQSQDFLVYQENDDRFFVGLHRTKTSATGAGKLQFK